VTGCPRAMKIELRGILYFLCCEVGFSNLGDCATLPKKMMRLVEISRQETNAVIRDLFPLVHRGVPVLYNNV
jgi:hypothetical protein